MRKHYMIILFITVVVGIFAAFLFLYNGEKQGNSSLNGETPEKDAVFFDISRDLERGNIMLTPPETKNLGGSAYLLEPDFVLTEEQLSQSLRDFFAAPCVLDFYLEDSAGGVILRSENAVRSSLFGEVMADAEFSVISMRKYEAAVAGGSLENPYHEATYDRAYFANAIGQISVVIGKDGTYLDFYRKPGESAEKTESGRTFFSETNLYPQLLNIRDEILADCTVLH